jgi:hypothetical protein
VDTGQVSLTLTLAAAYGLTLIYFYQLGFLFSVGFQYASLTSPFDVLSNGGVILGYVVSIFWAAILLVMSVQGASQLGFSLARWIVDYQLLITLVTLTVIIAAVVNVLRFRGHFHFLLIAVAINLIGLLAQLYGTVLTDQKVPIWTLMFAIVSPLPLSFGLGFQSAQYVKTIDRRRYEISLGGETISNVRILRISSAGIMYIRHNTSLVLFVSMSKIEKIAQTA